MNLKVAIRRAKRGLREDYRLYFVAVSSLTVAFLGLGASLLFMTNVGKVAEHWGRSGRMSVYLVDGAQAEDIETLRGVLTALPEVEEVTFLSSREARRKFLEESEVETGLSGLPPEAFPASMEVQLAPGTQAHRSTEIATRVGAFRAVSDVESYRGWFDRLANVLMIGKTLSAGLAILVLICVLAVVGNTIRLAVAGRRQEIEVMKLCGATDNFVRGPFLLEGAFQGLLSAGLSVALLLVAYLLLRPSLDASLATLTGIRLSFIEPIWVIAVIALGGLMGAMGSAVSLRRYLVV